MTGETIFNWSKPALKPRWVMMISIFASAGYVFVKVSTDPQVFDVTGVGVDTVAMVVLLFSLWTVLLSFVGVAFKYRLLSSLSYSCAYFGVRGVTPLPRSIEELLGHVGFLLVFMVVPAIVGTLIGSTPQFVARTWSKYRSHGAAN